MKNLKSIFLSFCFIFTLQTNMVAHENPITILNTSADKAFVVTNKKHKLLQTPANGGSVKFYPLLNIKKIKQSPVAQVLNWDMKFKFRLSRNLNIIFSYN